MVKTHGFWSICPKNIQPTGPPGSARNGTQVLLRGTTHDGNAGQVGAADEITWICHEFL